MEDNQRTANETTRHHKKKISEQLMSIVASEFEKDYKKAKDHAKKTDSVLIYHDRKNYIPEEDTHKLIVGMNSNGFIFEGVINQFLNNKEIEIITENRKILTVPYNSSSNNLRENQQYKKFLQNFYKIAKATAQDLDSLLVFHTKESESFNTNDRGQFAVALDANDIFDFDGVINRVYQQKQKGLIEIANEEGDLVTLNFDIKAKLREEKEYILFYSDYKVE